jgi:hypothetical protein
VLNNKDKSCKNPNGKAFNNYMLNKYQDATNNFAIAFINKKVQKALAKDAVSSFSVLIEILCFNYQICLICSALSTATWKKIIWFVRKLNILLQ